MAQISDRGVGLDVREYMKDGQQADQQLDDLIRAIKKDRTKAADLAKVQIKELTPAGQQKMAQLLAQMLKGQLPPGVGKQLIGGDADPAMLQQLMDRLANSSSQDPNSRFGIANSADAARAGANDPSVPQQALRWAQFVQKAQHVPGSILQGRAGSAAPKGEGTSLMELIAKKLTGNLGPGLRTPRLIQKGMQDLSPMQRAMLMKATFGDNMANALQELGIDDPMMLVKAGSLPSDRAQLAKALGIPRGRLLGLLMRAEMLKIGPGRNGEIGIRPEFLGPLKEAGVAMLGTLAALRALSTDELKHIYRKLRLEAGGFANVIKGGRIPVKRDLIHWARTASRKRSDILLANSEEWREGLGKHDAEELIQAWYLENLLWQELAYARQRQSTDDYWRYTEMERQRQEQEERDQQDDDDDEFLDDSDMEFDSERQDNLMCFWIIDHNTSVSSPGATRRMYVCIDPETGAIIPQSIEKEEIPTPLTDDLSAFGVIVSAHGGEPLCPRDGPGTVGGGPGCCVQARGPEEDDAGAGGTPGVYR